MRVYNSDLLGAGLCSGGQIIIAHFQSGQTVLCALGIDQIQNFLTVVLGVRIFRVREDQHPVVVVDAALVVANAHGGGIGVQDALAGKIGSHPLIHCGIGGGAAGHVVLAGGNIADTVLCQNGEIALTVGTNVGVRNCQLLGTLHCSGIVAAVAQSNGSQTSLCALVIDQGQEAALVSVFLKVGVLFLHGSGSRHGSLCCVCGDGLEACKTKNHSQRHSSCCDILHGTHCTLHKIASGLLPYTV